MLTVSATPSIRARFGTRPLVGRAPALLSADNDTAFIQRGTLSSLRDQEKCLLSDLACGDVDSRAIVAELALVRRSMIAAGARQALRVAS